MHRKSFIQVFTVAISHSYSSEIWTIFQADHTHTHPLCEISHFYSFVVRAITFLHIRPEGCHTVTHSGWAFRMKVSSAFTKNVNLGMSSSTNSLSIRLCNFYPIVRKFLRDRAFLMVQLWRSSTRVSHWLTAEILSGTRSFSWNCSSAGHIFRSKSYMESLASGVTLSQFPWQILPAVGMQLFRFCPSV